MYNGMKIYGVFENNLVIDKSQNFLDTINVIIL